MSESLRGESAINEYKTQNKSTKFLFLVLNHIRRKGDYEVAVMVKRDKELLHQTKLRLYQRGKAEKEMCQYTKSLMLSGGRV